MKHTKHHVNWVFIKVNNTEYPITLITHVHFVDCTSCILLYFLIIVLHPNYIMRQFFKIFCSNIDYKNSQEHHELHLGELVM